MTHLQKVHHIQQSFRAALDAMARPGTLRAIPDRTALSDEKGRMTQSFYLDALITMMIDQAVSFCVLGEAAADVTKAVREETHARPRPASQASFLIVTDAGDEDSTSQAFAEATGGEHKAPERGATVILACRYLAEGNLQETEEGLYWVSVEGPGVLGAHVFGVSDARWVWERSKRNDEYPCGIDILLVDEDGRLVAIPRTSFISILAIDEGCCPGGGSKASHAAGGAPVDGIREGKEGLPWAM